MLASAAAAALGWLAVVPSVAGDGSLRVEGAWARATIGASAVSAVYLAIVNRGTASDRLVGADAERAGHAAIHRSVVEDGVMKMRHVETVEVPAGGTIRLEPGGLHVMLTGIASRLEVGERISLTLRFERAGKLELAVPVRTTPPR